jgi:hypothetical protein
LRLSFTEVEEDVRLYEYGVLVTSLKAEILTIAGLYRDRVDCENNFHELKNQWGWGGFTTTDLKRCWTMASMTALAYDWWTIFARLAEPDKHREAITARPLLLTAPDACASRAVWTAAGCPADAGGDLDPADGQRTLQVLH